MKDVISAVLGLVVGGFAGYFAGFQGGIFLAHSMGIDNFSGRVQTYADVGGYLGMAVLGIIGAVVVVVAVRTQEF